MRGRTPADERAERARTRHTPASVGRALAAALLVATVGAVAIGGAAVPAAAGDAPTVFDVAPEETDVEAGETVELDVELFSDGSYTGDGLVRYDFVVATHPDVARIESVEAGPFLAGEDGRVEAETTRVEDGAVRVEHERAGAENGTTGNRVAATVRVRVLEDAPAGEAAVAVTDASAYVVGGDPIDTIEREATLTVDGGGLRAYQAPYAVEQEQDEGEGPGVTTAAEAGRDVETGDDGDDPVPGFGALAALGAVLLGTVLVGARWLVRGS